MPPSQPRPPGRCRSLGMPQYGPLSAPPVGISTGRSDAVSSLGSTRWSHADCCAIPRTAARGGRIVAVLWEAVAGPSGAAHPSDSWARVFIEIAADLESLEIVAAIPMESIRFLPDGRLVHIPSLSGLVHWTKDAAESRRLVHCLLAVPRTKDMHVEFASGEGTEREKDSEPFGSKRGGGASYEAPLPSRVSGHSGTRLHARKNFA